MKNFALDETPYYLENPRERAIRKAELAGLSIVACKHCGGPATREELQSRRPGRPPLHRTVVRCLEKRQGCPVEVSDLPLPEAPVELQAVEVACQEAKERSTGFGESAEGCECGCGQPAGPGKRFADRGCVGRYARQFRGHKRAETLAGARDELSLVYEAMRRLQKLPRSVRKKALELLESAEECFG